MSPAGNRPDARGFHVVAVSICLIDGTMGMTARLLGYKLQSIQEWGMRQCTDLSLF